MEEVSYTNSSVGMTEFIDTFVLAAPFLLSPNQSLGWILLPLPRLRGHNRKLHPYQSRYAPAMSLRPSTTSLVPPKTLFGASVSFPQVPVELWPPLRGKGWPVDASRVLPTTTITYPANSERRISRRGVSSL